jgi:hypothetical protein
MIVVDGTLQSVTRRSFQRIACLCYWVLLHKSHCMQPLFARRNRAWILVSGMCLCPQKCSCSSAGSAVAPGFIS